MSWVVFKDRTMLLSFLMSYFTAKRPFTWSPALDMSDHVIYSTLLPVAQS